MKTFVNLTPHVIRLNDGREFPASGQVARVKAIFTPFEDGICGQEFGEVEGLPPLEPGTVYIVSAIVLSALKHEGRPLINFVAPATGHPECKRDEKGQIVSVPGFVR